MTEKRPVRVDRHNPSNDPGIQVEREGFARRVHEAELGFRASAMAINELTDMMTPRISESVFVRQILPDVRSWVRREPNANIRNWLNVVGTPNAAAYIVTSDGTELYLPPPVLDNVIPDKPNEPGKPTDHTLLGVQLHAERSGDLRTVMKIEEQIPSLYTIETIAEDRAKAVTALTLIYKHFNLPMEELLGSLADKADKILSAKPTDDTQGLDDENYGDEY